MSSYLSNEAGYEYMDTSAAIQTSLVVEVRFR